uniref:Uncharacterized protein n=1 Tax=Arabidopsis thaliana TaxID=3702 RepID=Q56Y08_ARATH|nr:hypothetical protein [Arabidopsis thaliana]
MRLFREIQIVHSIHGKRGTSPSPVGGKLVRSFEVSRPFLSDVIWEEQNEVLKGDLSQIELAKLQ